MSRRAHAERILRAAAAGADPAAAVRAALRIEGSQLQAPGAEPYALDRGRIFIVGAGKATPRMAAAALELVGEHRVAGGSVTTRHGQPLELPGIDVWEAGHPLPDVHSLAGAAEALRVARAAGEHDLVLCLLSGGASALWAAPPDGVTLADLRAAFDALLRSGAPVQAMNVVRRRLSRVAGGRLAAAAAPARVLTLAVSDVVGSQPEAIGSGPTVGDPSTFADAIAVLDEWRVAVPAAVHAYLHAGAAGTHDDTVRPGDERLARSEFRVIADLRAALDAAAREAERLGYAAIVVDDRLDGPAEAAAEALVAAALDARRSGAAQARALLCGGETTVAVRGDGRGGRNQQLALAAALRIADAGTLVVGALATDGSDGPTDAAGAIVDAGTLARARDAGLDAAAHLARNDAYPLLRATGDLVLTGPTGTNVNDVVVALIEASR